MILNVIKQKIMHSINKNENVVSNTNKIANCYNNFLNDLLNLNINFLQNISISIISKLNVNVNKLRKIFEKKLYIKIIWMQLNLSQIVLIKMNKIIIKQKFNEFKLKFSF